MNKLAQLKEQRIAKVAQVDEILKGIEANGEVRALNAEERTKIAEFINAKHREEIIFSKNATESLNLIAYSYGMDNIKKDDEVVISIMEHHSNLVPWQKVTKATGSTLKYMYINIDFHIHVAILCNCLYLHLS